MPRKLYLLHQGNHIKHSRGILLILLYLLVDIVLLSSAKKLQNTFTERITNWGTVTEMSNLSKDSDLNCWRWKVDFVTVALVELTNTQTGKRNWKPLKQLKNS